MNQKIKVSFEIEVENLPKLNSFFNEIWSKNPVEKTEPTELVEKAEPKESVAQNTQSTVSQTDIRTAAAKLVKSNRGKELNALFKTFGATKLSDLPEEKYADFLTALEEL